MRSGKSRRPRSAALPGNFGVPSVLSTPLIGERLTAKLQPIAATRNERVSSMLPRTPFGASSCNEMQRVPRDGRSPQGVCRTGGGACEDGSYSTSLATSQPRNFFDATPICHAQRGWPSVPRSDV